MVVVVENVVLGVPFEMISVGLNCTHHQHSFIQPQGVKNVIITLGARGAYALVQGDEAAAPSCPMVEVVDTTGAGDAFGAGVLYSLSAQLAEAEGGVKAFDWQAALRWGCAAGAHAVTKVGASAPPTGRDEIEAYLKSMP